MRPEEQHAAFLADLTCGDEGRAEVAARSLAEIGAPIVPALGQLLESADPDQRWWSVRTLAQMTSPRADWLIRALGDASPDVRAAAALALSGHPTEEAAAALTIALQDEDSVVAILAVNALVAIGKPAVQLLLDELPRANPRGRIQIMRALAELRDHRAIRVMMNAVEGDSAMLRYWAQEGLERLGLNMVYVKPE